MCLVFSLSGVLEKVCKINTILLDKTGTLTLGRPKLVDIVSFNGKSDKDVLRLACIAEKYSEHPLARSILRAAKERNIDIPDPEHFTSAAGMGVEAQCDGARILVGKQSFLQESGVAVSSQVVSEVTRQSEQGRSTKPSKLSYWQPAISKGMILPWCVSRSSWMLRSRIKFARPLNWWSNPDKFRFPEGCSPQIGWRRALQPDVL